jgi:hypothetical protein
MAENQPPGKAYTPPGSAMQDCSLALSKLCNANGNGKLRGAVKPPVQHMYEVECTFRASADKKLAEAMKKIAHLIELREKRNLDLVKAQSDNNFLFDSSKSENSLAKKLFGGQKALSKKELDGQKAHATSLMNNKKEAIKVLTAAKSALKKEFDKQKKAYEALQKLQEQSNKQKLSQSNCSEASLMRTQTDLQNKVKALKKEIN